VSRISARGVDVTRGDNHVLIDVDLTVEPGEWIGLIGPNGAGKTTLLHTLAGALPYRGDVRVDGVPLSALDTRSRARTLAVVSQDPVMPQGMLVFDYVMLGRTPHLGFFEREGAADAAVVGRALGSLELTDVAERPLDTLSGGQLQRVALARALAQETPILLLDEPTSALDVGHRVQVLEHVEALRHERGLTVVTAMHDLTLAAQFCDRLVLLSAGRVVAAGSARAVLTEDAIRRHYGAEVTLLEGPDGTVVVIPLRRRRTMAAEEAAR
jgi:iron complex transport system ATP-binding protein